MRNESTALCLAVVTLLATSPVRSAEPDLIGNMGDLQRFSHKLDLAIGENNLPLADFYAHELEETIESTTAIERYHDQPIGELTTTMLVPAFERLEAALDAEPINPQALNAAFDGYVAACNACHLETGYGCIRIERTDTSPFMQSFAPLD